MHGRAWLTLALLVSGTAALAGCVGEPIEVALRVREGTTLVLLDATEVDGSILVEGNATLLIEDATLEIAQGILVEPGATLRATKSTLVFGGRFASQFLRAEGVVVLDETHVRGLDEVQVAGALASREGSIDAGCLLVVGGGVASDATDWTLDEAACAADDWGWHDSALRVSGVASFENGTIQVSGERAAATVDAGTLHIGNSTWDARTREGFALHGGDVDVWSSTLLVRDRQRFVEGHEGTLSLVDSTYPRNAQLPTLSGSAQLRVSWTLTVRAVQALGGAAVPGLNVTLASADAPGSTSARAMTDERGEARFIALQYVYQGNGVGSRTGNPHVLRADEGGRRGAVAGLVFESPATVTLPIVGAGALAEIADVDALDLEPLQL